MEFKIGSEVEQKSCQHCQQLPDSVGNIDGRTVSRVSAQDSVPQKTSQTLQEGTADQRLVVSCQQRQRQLKDSLNHLYARCRESKDTINQWETIRAFNNTLGNLLQISPTLQESLFIRKEELDGIKHAKLTPKGVMKALALRFPDQVKSGHLEYWHLDFHPDKIDLESMKIYLRSEYGEEEASLMYKSDEELKILIHDMGSRGMLSQLTYPRSLVCLGTMLCNKMHSLNDGQDSIMLVDFGIHCSVLYLRKKNNQEYRCLLLDSLESFTSQYDPHSNMESEVCLIAIQAALMDRNASSNLYYLPCARQNSKVHCRAFAFHDIGVLIESPMIPNGGYQASAAKDIGIISTDQAFRQTMYSNSGCGISINNQRSVHVPPEGAIPFMSCLDKVLAPRMDAPTARISQREEFRIRLLKLKVFPASLLDFTQSRRELERVAEKLPPAEILSTKKRIENTSGLSRTDKGEEKRLNLAAQLSEMATIISLVESH